MTHDDDQLLPETEAAPRCGVKRQTLQMWRQQRRGPPFIKVEGAVRYSRRDLEAWLASRTVRP